MEKLNKTHEENALKRDKAIQGLVQVIHKKEKEVSDHSEEHNHE